jgi:hypothetical protein
MSDPVTCFTICFLQLAGSYNLCVPVFRIDAEEALQGLNGSVIGKQTVRLSWGRSPSHKQVGHVTIIFLPVGFPCYNVNFHRTNNLAKIVSKCNV